MALTKFTHPYRGLGVIVSFILVSGILWNTYLFFNRFKQEERVKMEILSKAYERFSAAELNTDVSLEHHIIEHNQTVPMIITDKRDSITMWSNLPPGKVAKEGYLRKQLALMKNQNKPIVVSYTDKGVEKFRRYIYYRNSDLLTKLKYYPIALILIICLFATVIYLFFRSSKIADENKLWTGMARETAHQLGTPLSSLLGWIELIRSEKIDTKILAEIEKDTQRLHEITNRFSKIGSFPSLEMQNVVPVTMNAVHYLQSRTSKQVDFDVKSSKEIIEIPLNRELYGWVIENLVKNALDAMNGKGRISLEITEDDKAVFVRVSDTGKGLSKKVYKQVFSPGYTTKKRGWGLGLSLAKRIVEDYHKGSIKVLQSTIRQGTTFVIVLNK
jgi:hypothetical protein